MQRDLWILVIYISLIIGIAVASLSSLGSLQTKVLPYSEFRAQLNQGNIKDVVVEGRRLSGILNVPNGKEQSFATNIVDKSIADDLFKSGVSFSGAQPRSWLDSIIPWGGAALALMLMFSLWKQKPDGERGAAGPIPAIERNRARLYMKNDLKVLFDDVAGVDEAKAELEEVVRFLQEPQEYKRIGARLPKGVLLVGPPGTGKTLLARAVAGQAGVAFFSISGSEFVELYVGVGAARVRDLFAQARQHAPCIIFIDELDALGRSRAAGPLAGAHDESEQTLNQLLVELDGFDPSSGVILLAATNRPELLDQALLRAGRFDRHIVVDRPDKKGRREILQLHLRHILVAKGIDVDCLATTTAGFSGADLANIVNEAALLAVRRNAEQVTAADFDNAVERVVAGLAKKNRLLSAKERQTVAFHEMGHAIVAIELPGAEQVQKVSIIPRGVAGLGYTMQRPSEDRFVLTRTEITNKLSALLGGLAAECLVFGEPTTGASDDLQKATQLARSFVMRFGMDRAFGLIAVEEQPAFCAGNMDSTAVSPDTLREADCAVRLLLKTAFENASSVLLQNRGWLERSATELLSHETLPLAAIMKCKSAALLPVIDTSSLAKQEIGAFDLPADNDGTRNEAAGTGSYQKASSL